MKYHALLLLATTTAIAQQTRSTCTYDVNGRCIEAPQTSSANGSQRQTVQTVNGRPVPIESVEERVVSDDGRTKIVERVVRRFTPNGQPGPPERVRIEERKQPDGSKSTATTVWRGDLNGNMQLAERTLADTKKSGSLETTTTTVERPTLNGSFELTERREDVTRELAAGAASQTSTLFRRDSNGRFQETGRAAVERSVQNGTVVENEARYELGKLVRQTVSRTSKVGETGEKVEVDVFTSEAAGRAQSESQGRPQLRERRLIERTFTSNGSVESVSVQVPAAPDSSQLSRPRKAEETVCTGKCR